MKQTGSLTHVFSRSARKGVTTNLNSKFLAAAFSATFANLRIANSSRQVWRRASTCHHPR
jgi:hypothetical protein